MEYEKCLFDEQRERINRARDLMERHNIDAFLLLTGANLVYFSGATGMLGGRSGSRPFILILPRKGDPTLIVQGGRQYESRALTCIEDIRIYSRLSQLPLETVMEVIEENHLYKGRIGMELDNEMVVDLPFYQFMRLKNNLPDVDFFDASPLLWQLRMIKSSLEIASITKACSITSEAYTNTFQSIHSGMTENEIETIMLGNMISLGGKAPWVIITSGEGNYDLISKGSSPRRVKNGDMVWMDAGCSYFGYCSDFSRAGVIGEPSPIQKKAQRTMHELTMRGMDMLRPGMPVADVAVYMNRAVKGLDLPITSNISELAGRVGHGMGMFITEPPNLNEEDKTVLMPGMVVTIEPGVATKFGVFHIEENVLITNGEPIQLSSYQWDLWPIG